MGGFCSGDTERRAGKRGHRQELIPRRYVLYSLKSFCSLNVREIVSTGGKGGADLQVHRRGESRFVDDKDDVAVVGGHASEGQALKRLFIGFHQLLLKAGVLQAGSRPVFGG